MGPIRCLKSHLHLLHSLCCPSLPLSFRLSNHLIFQPRSSTPPAAAARVIDTFIVLLFLTPCASAPNQITPATCTGLEGSWDLSHRGLSSTPHLTPSEALIPSSLSLRNGRGRARHRASVVRKCVLSRAKGNQRSRRVSQSELRAQILVVFLLFNDTLSWPVSWIDWVEWVSVRGYMDLSLCACIITCWQWGWWLCLSDLWECAVKGLLSRILFPEWWLLSLSLCVCVRVCMRACVHACVCVCIWKQERLRGRVLQVSPQCNQSPPCHRTQGFVDYHFKWYIVGLFFSLLHIHYFFWQIKQKHSLHLHYTSGKEDNNQLRAWGVGDHDSSTTCPNQGQHPTRTPSSYLKHTLTNTHTLCHIRIQCCTRIPV